MIVVIMQHVTRGGEGTGELTECLNRRRCVLKCWLKSFKQKRVRMETDTNSSGDEDETHTERAHRLVFAIA